jgi:hypothetical protein
MPIRLKRRIALLLVALAAFTQVNAAMASCAMGGGMTAPAMTGMAGEPCDGCDTPLNNPRDQMASVCATHCATGAQLGAVTAAISVPTIQRTAFVLPRPVLRARATGLDAPPPGAPPRRVLLHSFLI